MNIPLHVHEKALLVEGKYMEHCQNKTATLANTFSNVKINLAGKFLREKMFLGRIILLNEETSAIYILTEKI